MGWPWVLCCSLTFTMLRVVPSCLHFYVSDTLKHKASSDFLTDFSFRNSCLLWQLIFHFAFLVYFGKWLFISQFMSTLAIDISFRNLCLLWHFFIWQIMSTLHRRLISQFLASLAFDFSLRNSCLLWQLMFHFAIYAYFGSWLFISQIMSTLHIRFISQSFYTVATDVSFKHCMSVLETDFSFLNSCLLSKLAFHFTMHVFMETDFLFRNACILSQSIFHFAMHVYFYNRYASVQCMYIFAIKV